KRTRDFAIVVVKETCGLLTARPDSQCSWRSHTGDHLLPGRAGYLEGYFTQMKPRRNHDSLWKQMGLILAQLDGLHAGAAEWLKIRNREVGRGLNMDHYPCVGDLLDLIPALTRHANSSTVAGTCRMPGMGHCTALIKVLSGFENLLPGHSSWFFHLCLKIYLPSVSSKHDHTLVLFLLTILLFLLHHEGLLTSLDDFHLGIFNTSLFSEVTPRSLLAWHRVCMANREWAHVFSQYNAGEILSDRSVSLELLFFHYKGYIHTNSSSSYSDSDLLFCSPAHFCVTVQVTDYQMALQLAAEAINGPTTQGGLPPLLWQSFHLTTHQGLPHTFNFSFITVGPSLQHP
uniref:Phospholipase B-like n=1 Tax=Cynoglossus semilaevis TaxID=244447 RepID=A0A3P8X1W2_CYNSE